MKRSILFALITSVLFWLIFMGFAYWLASLRLYFTISFTPYAFFFNLVLLVAPWICCGVLSRWLIAERHASFIAALIYLVACVLSIYLALRLSVPLHRNSTPVASSLDVVRPPLEAGYCFALLFALTLTRSFTNLRKK